MTAVTHQCTACPSLAAAALEACNHCGLTVSRLQWVPQNYDKIAEDDLEKPLVQGRDNLLHNALINFIGDVRDCTVLDIGSSNGLYLAQLNAKMKVAADLALPYLSDILSQTNIMPICCDAEYLPVKLRLFD